MYPQYNNNIIIKNKLKKENTYINKTFKKRNRLYMTKKYIL
jgi:hypothetical protein